MKFLKMTSMSHVLLRDLEVSVKNSPKDFNQGKRWSRLKLAKDPHIILDLERQVLRTRSLGRGTLPAYDVEDRLREREARQVSVVQLI